MDSQFTPLRDALSSVLFGKLEVIELTLIGALGGGHLLIENLPGVGKTTLCRAISTLLGESFQRVQFTADLMPSDLTGVNVFRPQDGRFEFIRGPLFCHVLLADEINRASPKLQSSLLEAMAEGQVTVDRESYPLPSPFWVIATQNPASFEGTYPLPESQLDRFGLSTSIGYPARDAERAALRQRGGESALSGLEPLMSAAQWAEAREQVERVHVSDAIIDYLLELCAETRAHPELRVGVSTRGALSWQRSCMARARLYGRDFVSPDDVKRLAVPALAHRIWSLRAGSTSAERSAMISRLLERVKVPR